MARGAPRACTRAAPTGKKNARKPKSRSKAQLRQATDALAKAQQARRREAIEAKLLRALHSALGARGPGVPVTEEQARAVIVAYLAANSPEVRAAKGASISEAARLRVAASAANVSYNKCVDIINHFKATRKVLCEDTGNRGAGSERYKDPNALPDDGEDAVKALVLEELAETQHRPDITRLRVKHFLWDTYKITWSVDRVGRLLGKLGFDFGPLNRQKGGAPSLARLLQKRMYVIQLYSALKAGDILVWTDESYDNVRNASKRGWAVRGVMEAASVGKDGPGERLCFVHALSRHGLVTKVVSGKPVDAPLGSTDARDTAYMVFPAQKQSGVDYHGNFENGVFMGWVRNRLLPGLESQFPGAFGAKPKQRITVVFDNAPYHCKVTPDLAAKAPRARRWRPADMSKPDLFAQLRALGCKTLHVRHEEHKGGKVKGVQTIVTPTTPAEAAKKAVAGKVAYLDEIRLAAEDWLAANAPSVLRNDLEAALAAAGNVRVLWNAPNFPEGNPIEMVWARVKAFTAHSWTKGRDRTTLARELWTAFHTDSYARPGVTRHRGGNYVPKPGRENEAAVKLIDHVLYAERGGCLGAIRKDRGVLKGTMKALEVDAYWTRLAERNFEREALRIAVRQELFKKLQDQQLAAAQEAEADAAGADDADL
jgi:hypothetical protein